MGRFDLSDEDIDRIFSGRKGPAGGGLDDFSGTLEGIRSAFIVPIAESTEQAHLAAIHEAAAKIGEGTTIPAAELDGARKNRRKSMLGALSAPLGVKFAAVALAGTVLTGALGMTGNIPGEGQEIFEKVAHSVGFKVDGDPIEDKSANVKVKGENGPENGDQEVPDVEKTPGVNHGHCVAYAATEVAKELAAGDKGHLIRIVAADKDAVSAKVPDGGTADAACTTAISEAMAQVAAANTTEEAKTNRGSGVGANSEGKSQGEVNSNKNQSVKVEDDGDQENKKDNTPGNSPVDHPSGKP